MENDTGLSPQAISWTLSLLQNVLFPLLVGPVIRTIRTGESSSWYLLSISSAIWTIFFS